MSFFASNSFQKSPEHKAWKDRLYKEHCQGKCDCMCADSTIVPDCISKIRGFDIKAPEFQAWIKQRARRS